LGLPASTTHVISSSIIGLGVSRAISGISWRTVGRMVLAWLVTFPTAGILAGISYLVLYSWI
jgi:PiT family inorganic phosphate transporter